MYEICVLGLIVCKLCVPGESSIQLALFSATSAASEIFDYLVRQCAADINIKVNRN